ncbi:hypothetical protein [Rhodanobacter sp. L36]|uniref:hypothetical protein n=1 Tax=Rhodanobacter sp. L36 TaxID=1747221 RepID=UPI0031B6AC20
MENDVVRLRHGHVRTVTRYGTQMRMSARERDELFARHRMARHFCFERIPLISECALQHPIDRGAGILEDVAVKQNIPHALAVLQFKWVADLSS